VIAIPSKPVGRISEAQSANGLAVGNAREQLRG
jgi:hypothetical protein